MWGCGVMRGGVGEGGFGNSRGSDLELYQKTMLTFGAWLCICACVLSHLGTGAGGRDTEVPTCLQA